LPWRIAILQQTSGQAPLTAGVVILDHRARAAGPLEVGADVVGGHAAHYGLDAVAVPSLHSGQAAVVDEGGAGCAAYGRQAVFGIVAEALYMLPLYPVLWAHFTVYLPHSCPVWNVPHKDSPNCPEYKRPDCPAITPLA